MKYINDLRFNNKNQQGFSLIEVVLVIMLIGFLILIISNLPSSFRLIGKSKNESLAREIAVSEIENQRAKTYINLANTSNPLPQISDSRISQLPQGNGTIEIKDCPNTICQRSEQTKQVIVTVNWIQDTQVKTVQLTTLISNGGLE